MTDCPSIQRNVIAASEEGPKIVRLGGFGMAGALSPTGALSQLLKTDPQTSKLLVAGLAVIACAAIVASWQIDAATAGLIGLYIAGLGAVVIIIAGILNDDLLRRILSLALVLIIILVVAAFAVSALFRDLGFLNPTYCMVRPWERCDLVEERIVDENRGSIDSTINIPATAAPPADSSFQPGAFKVFIQFAGLMARDEVTKLNQSLSAGGWKVQGGSGQRVASAAGLNEVRYSSNDASKAAQALADAITNTKITSSPVSIRQVGIIKQGTLEVWISK